MKGQNLAYNARNWTVVATVKLPKHLPLVSSRAKYIRANIFPDVLVDDDDEVSFIQEITTSGTAVVPNTDNFCFHVPTHGKDE